MVKTSGRKIGRNKLGCQSYRSQNRKNKNKERRLKKQAKKEGVSVKVLMQRNKDGMYEHKRMESTKR